MISKPIYIKVNKKTPYTIYLVFIDMGACVPSSVTPAGIVASSNKVLFDLRSVLRAVIRSARMECCDFSGSRHESSV